MNNQLLIKTELVLLFILIAMASFGNDNTNILYAGASKIDITPEKSVQMAGYTRDSMSQGIHDRLYARAIVFKMNAGKIVFVSTDVIGFGGEVFEYIRQPILNKFEIEASQLFLSAIHTHSGPSLTINQEQGHKNNVEYTKELRGKLLEVIEQASQNMIPVTVGVAVGSSPVGVNRRQVRYDDQLWPKDTYVRLGNNENGPADREVLVMKLSDDNYNPVAVLFDYACHATSLGKENFDISSDFFGLSEQFVEQAIGQDFVAAGFAGASGNIKPWYSKLPGFNTEPGLPDKTELQGKLLGIEVVELCGEVKEVKMVADIAADFTTLQLPAKKRGTLATADSLRKQPLNVTVARIGDIGFVGLGGEILTEIGMEIKKASPFKHTFIITHCNGSSGYLPPENLYKEGGYEVLTSRFAPESEQIVVKKVLEMMYNL